MSDRYFATASNGTPVVRTNDREQAEECARILGGSVIDRAMTTALQA